MKADYRHQLKLSRELTTRLRAYKEYVSETCGRSVSMNEILVTIVEEFLESLDREEKNE